jgi:hypothetical protein
VDITGRGAYIYSYTGSVQLTRLRSHPCVKSAKGSAGGADDEASPVATTAALSCARSMVTTMVPAAA